MADNRTPLSRAAHDIFGLSLTGWAESAPQGRGGRTKASAQKPDAVGGQAVYVAKPQDLEKALAALRLSLPQWQKTRLATRRGEAVPFAGPEGPVWILTPTARSTNAASHGGLLDPSPYGLARDVFGLLAAQVGDYGLASLDVSFIGASDEEQLGAVVGLELGGYRFRQVRQPDTSSGRPKLSWFGVAPDLVEQGAGLGVSTNLARHLVNLPPSLLHPEAFAQLITDLFAKSSTTRVDIWNGKRLEKERAGLLMAVGRGAEHGPQLVHIRYRPKGKVRRARPLALVGKGITFDTGGLDIKDSGSMRLMKKDMGGAASLVGLAYWAERSGVDVPLDIYLAIAENAVDQHSFKPGDIITARNGQTVEIDNTDAEGRLVLADAIDVALSATGKDQPTHLIDLATLTGAMRVGLGTRFGGLFANDDALADSLLNLGQKRGDVMWRMPLFSDYASGLKSVVADVANSGPGRFGGAITAALFLQRFVRDTAWAHVDMYGWTEGGHGALNEAGGNGQCVQALAAFLEEF